MAALGFPEKIAIIKRCLALYSHPLDELTRGNESKMSDDNIRNMTCFLANTWEVELTLKHLELS